jgi:SAM-dependent methyltransferase
MHASHSPPTETERIREAYLHRNDKIPKDRYSVFQEDNLLLRQQLERGIIGLLKRYGHGYLEREKILEVGCGAGHWLRQFVQWGAEPKNLHGIDLLSDKIDVARYLCPPGISFHCGDASYLEFEDQTFDLVLQFTVFTSILQSEMRKSLAREMSRVLKPNGGIIWFDFFISNPKNPDVRGVTRSEIEELFPGWTFDVHRIVLAPPVARAVAPISPALCRLLSTLKLLCTHYLCWIQRA